MIGLPQLDRRLGPQRRPLVEDLDLVLGRPVDEVAGQEPAAVALQRLARVGPGMEQLAGLDVEEQDAVAGGDQPILGHAQQVGELDVVGDRIALPEQPAAAGVEREDRVGVAGGHEDPAVVDHRRIQVALAAIATKTIGLLAGIGRHPERRPRLRLERNHRAQVGLIVEGRPVERQQPMIEVARRGHAAELHRPHAEKVVAIRRRRPQVADPAARAGVGVEAGDVGRGLLAAIGDRDVDVAPVGDRRPLEADRPIAAVPIGGPVGKDDRRRLLLPEHLALGVPVESDDRARTPSPSHARHERPALIAPIRA